MGSGDGRDVHSIVCACFDAVGDAVPALGDLQRRLTLAIDRSGRAAERVVDLDVAFAAIFLNSTAAIECARQLCAQASAAVPLKLGVHIGPLDPDDAQIGQRAPLRLARQIAVLAPVGRTLVSPLFHHFVTQFDHACKHLIHPASPVVDAHGRSVPVFEARFGPAPAAPDDGLAAVVPVRSAATPAEGFLPVEADRRAAFLARAERVLADEIGPLAKLIVRRAEASARTRTAFYQQLVEAVPDSGRRTALLKILGKYD